VVVLGLVDAAGDPYTASFRLGAIADGPVEVRVADRPLPDELGRFMVTGSAGLRRLQGMQGRRVALHVLNEAGLVADDLPGMAGNAAARLDRETSDLQPTERQRFLRIRAAMEGPLDGRDAPTGLDTAPIEAVDSAGPAGGDPGRRPGGCRHVGSRCATTP